MKPQFSIQMLLLLMFLIGITLAPLPYLLGTTSNSTSNRAVGVILVTSTPVLLIILAVIIKAIIGRFRR